MLCPENPNKDFDYGSCQSCKFYLVCTEKNKQGHLKKSDEYPCPFVPDRQFNEIDCQPCAYCKSCYKKFKGNPTGNKKAPANDSIHLKGRSKFSKLPKITKEELDKFKIDLGYIIYFEELITEFKMEK